MVSNWLSKDDKLTWPIHLSEPGKFKIIAEYENKGEEIDGISEWIMLKAKIPVKEYKELAKEFNPTEYNAEQYGGCCRGLQAWTGRIIDKQLLICLSRWFCEGFKMQPFVLRCV